MLRSSFAPVSAVTRFHGLQGTHYIIRWLKDGLVVIEDRFDNLKDAEMYAMAQIKLYRTLDVATSALICDDDGVEYTRIF
jgi:hypothetical protein